MRTIRPEKQEAVAALKEAFSKAKSVVLADNMGLTVAQVTKLRRELRQAGVELKVAKNTLIGIAAREMGIEGLEPYLHGTTTLAFSYEDEASAAKKIREFFAKEREPKFVVKAGILEGKVLDAAGVKELADLPRPARRCCPWFWAASRRRCRGWPEPSTGFCPASPTPSTHAHPPAGGFRGVVRNHILMQI